MNTQAMVEVVEPSLKWPLEPYPGLRPFRVTSEADETLIFYGRNQHKDEVLARLDKQHMVIVTGPSGCGKSSLILAGVLPILRAGLLSKAGSDWQIIKMRPGLAPIEQLWAAIGDLHLDDPQATKDLLSTDPFALRILAGDIDKADQSYRPRILLVIDQFEDIFGSHVPRDQVDQFIRLLVKYRERPHPLIYIIVTMRSDFLGFCTNFPGLAQTINETQFLTPILGIGELTEAIVRPAEDYGATIEKPLLDRLLTDMRPGAGYDPDNLALLQHALQWLWRRACRRTGPDGSASPRARKGRDLRIDLRSYEEAGGLPGILNSHADEVADGFSGEDAAVLKATLTRLAEKSPSGGYRRSPATIRDVVLLTGKTNAVHRIIDRLSSREVEFLECKSIHAGASDNTVVDLCHESLIRTWKRYKGWVDEEDFKLAVIVRRLVDDAMRWDEKGRRYEDLERGDSLTFRVQRWRNFAPTEQWAERYSLSPERSERLSSFLPLTERYLDASNAAEEEERTKIEAQELKNKKIEDRARRIKKYTIISLASIAFCGFGGFLALQAHNKQTEANDVKAGSLLVLAEDAIKRNDAPNALLWAREGLQKAANFGPRFENLTYRALQQLRLLRQISTSGIVTSVSFSPDTRFIVATHSDATMEFFSVATGKSLARRSIPGLPPMGFSFAQAHWSKSGDLVAFSGRDAVSLASVCDLDSFKENYTPCSKHQFTSDNPIILHFYNKISKAIFSPDGRKLLVQAGPAPFLGGQTMLYDIDKLLHSGEQAKPDVTIDKTTLAVAFSSDDTAFVVGLVTGGVQVYNVSNPSAPIITLRSVSHPTAPVSSLAFDGRSNDSFYSGSFEGPIMKWNAKTGAVDLFAAQDGPVFQLSTTSDGTWLLSSSDKGMLAMWSTREKTPANDRTPINLGPHRAPVRSFDIGDADLVVSAGGQNIFIWNRSGALQPHVKVGISEGGSVGSIKVEESPSTYTIVKSGMDYASFGRPKSAKPISLAIEDPSGNFFAFAERNGSILLYRKDWKTPIARFDAPDAPGRSWTALHFEAESGHIVADSNKGERFSWRYFPDVASMQAFVDRNIPIIGDEPMKLPPETLCLITQDACQKGAP